MSADAPLRIAYLSYRGKPHVGGQGVYTRHLSKALVDLGHTVEVLGGQPYPRLDERVPLVELPSLDIYNEHFPMRMPWIGELKQLADFVEVTSFSLGTFPEPLAFSVRAWQHLRNRKGEFDLVHDNQCLGYGLLAIERDGLPVVATIHHPITVDRRLEMEHAENGWQRWNKGRWYAFTKMQTRVASRMKRVITVSENSRDDIHRDHLVPLENMAIVPVGVDQEQFKPLPHIARVPGRLITTASADVAMKGLAYLLEAVAKIRTERPCDLVIIGKPKEEGRAMRTLEQFGLTDAVQWVYGVSDERIVELYAEAELAVVPSLYEGFSLPAIEAQCSGVPLVATTGGALKEVVGPDGETAFTCPPGDAAALAARINFAMDNPELAAKVGAASRQRVIDNWTWRHTAEKTVEQYRIRLKQG
jgi:glycosyltransferase involved in cell wall biosynthesis